MTNDIMTNDIMMKDIIDIAKGFQTSVNIAYDLNNDDKVRGFIPTMSSLDVIEDVLLSTSASASQRARILIGAYGRGKSHIILVLMSMLFRKDLGLFEPLLKKMKTNNPELCNYVTEYLKSDKRILPIIVRGSSSSLTQSFLSALQQALSVEGLSDLMPETHFKAALNTIENWRTNYTDTYKKLIDVIVEPIDDFVLSLKEYDVTAYERFLGIYPELTSGSSFNPFLGFDIVELYETITIKIKDIGYSGIYIVYDEFSKYLESSIANATISDIKLLQDFAEKCDRSGVQQMHLMLISHKDITNYIDNNLPKEKVDGWRGVSGRFKHINLHNNYSQMYEIISNVIQKHPKTWDAFLKQNQEHFDDLKQRFVKNGLLDKNNELEIKNAIEDCFPLHPISTFILPRLSEKVAQNERTLFTFLSADDKYTLLSFLESAEGDFPMLTPDFIYDYFQPLFRKEAYTSEVHKMYKLTASVLRKVDDKSLHAKIIKTIALIYLVEQFEKLSPIVDVIVDAYRDTVNDTTTINKALKELIENECIVYLKRSNGYLRIKESSGVDTRAEISTCIEKSLSSMRVTDILNRSSFDSYMYPTAYNDVHEITRYFDFTFIDSEDFFGVENWDKRIADITADGIVFAVIPDNEDDINKIQMAITKNIHPHNRILFVVPQKYTNIEKVALEYEAAKRLKAEVIEDEVLGDEYDIYIEDLSEVIGDFINSYARPETGGASYYYMGQKRQLRRKAQLSALLSAICSEIFYRTPIINNESINKNVLPTVAINSRTKILSGLLANELAPNIGLSGTGQDVSIMRSTLLQTGILTNLDTSPVINLEPEDENLHNMLIEIRNFFIGAMGHNGANFRALYNRLTLHEHGIGLKYGVIPIYIAVVLHLYKKNLVITYRGNEVKITPDLLNDINESPDDYIVILENWNEEKAEYMAQLEDLFSEYVIEREKDYNNFTYLMFAMNRWYMSLPKYTKEMTQEYLGKGNKRQINRSQRKFIATLKQFDSNPREFLFKKVLDIFGLQDFSITVVSAIRETKEKYDNAINRLTAALINDVKGIFAKGATNGSLASIVKDWNETLSDKTNQYLFSGNESRILELMMHITHDENASLQRLAKTVTSLRMEDWNSETIDIFLHDLQIFKDTIDQFNNRKGYDLQNKAYSYTIMFTDDNGAEITKVFDKTDYSDKAKLLLNEIETALEEMGQSITEQEKRQVLMEILARMCK